MDSNNLNGILLVNKEKGKTSRDVVNEISKKYQIKKVGHAGTLDPLATGLLVIGIGKGTKILDLLTLDTKEYIATVKIGLKTDTLDITGNVEKELKNINLTKQQLEKTLLTFKGTYNQEVPKYSAVKINGKRLYKYARNKEEVNLPKRLVEIKEIELLAYQENQEFTFKTLVSKGTYIRSLINDIGIKLNIPMTMKDLIRTKSGKFNLDNLKFISIQDSLDFKIVKIDNNLLKKVKNGNSLKLDETDLYITLVDNQDNLLAIYKKENDIYKSFKMF